MILYHGSNTQIEKIDLSLCKPYKDFGQGFYLTEIREQAELMAKRTATIYGGEPIVTEFSFDEQLLDNGDLDVKRFTEPDEEWALFVMKNCNRNGEHPTHSYDIVVGPVADDAIAVLFRNFDDSIIDLPTLVNGLKYKDISSQYFFHTANAVKHLKRL